MPILGIIASSFQSAAGPTGAYDALATVTLSSTTASVTFSGIPSGYKHLQIRFFGKNAYTAGSGFDNFNMAMNNDTTYTNYRTHYMYGNGTSALAGSFQSSGNYAQGCAMTRSYSTHTNIFGTGITDILDYSSDTKYKTIRSIGGGDINGGGELQYFSSMWMSTSPITSMVINCTTASFVSGTQFALYGVK